MKTIYQQAKAELKQTAKEAKRQYIDDLPAQRMVINDTADYLCKSLQLSDYQRNLLENYSCKLHPKK